MGEQAMVELWGRALPKLKEKMTSAGYNTWIQGMEPVLMQDNQFYLMVPQPYIRDFVISRYQTLIASTLQTAAGQPLEPRFLLPQEVEAVLSSQKPDPEPSQIPSGSVLNPKYTFDRFVIGNSNRFAHAASLAVAESPARAYNPLFIYGGVGLGKTHLMHAIGHFIRGQKQDARVMYVSSEKFTNELITAIQTRKNTEFRNRYRSVDVLLIDDVQFIAGKDSTQEEFFHTFNALHEADKQIILSSDKPPKEIPELEERLRSRFEWGLIADIQPPDLETRVAILRQKALAERATVADETLFFIASKIESNIRELEGSLTRLLAYHQLTGRPLDLSLARDALKDLLGDADPEAIDVERVMAVVGDYFTLRLEDFTSKRRTQDITLPRQYAMYLCRELTGVSLAEIGKRFGGRDHTTVIHAWEKISQSMRSDPNVLRTVEDLKYRLGRG